MVLADFPGGLPGRSCSDLGAGARIRTADRPLTSSIALSAVVTCENGKSLTSETALGEGSKPCARDLIAVDRVN